MSALGIEGLKANHADLAEVLTSLTDDEWAMPSACAGWRVQDVLAHITSNMKMMVNPDPPTADAPTDVKAEEAAEAMVAPRKAWTATRLMAEYNEYLPSFIGALTSMQDEPMASMVIPLADLGSHPMHILSDVFSFDHYCHLRHDMLGPAGPLTRSLPAADDARVRPGIDWMIAGLPHMCRAELTGADRPWVLELTGAGAGTWTVQPVGADGLVTVLEGREAGVGTVTSTAHDFVSWGTQRSNWRSSCALTGDSDYLAANLDAINII